MEFDVSGKTELTLKVRKKYDLYGDAAKASWLNARVTVAQNPAAAVSVLYKNMETSLNTNTLRPWLQVINNGSSPIDLADITIRYWYTRDTAAGQVYVCDFAQVGTVNITGAFTTISPRNGADTCLELGFLPGAGTLAPGAQTGEIQLRIHKSDWSYYDQMDDYSFDPFWGSFGENLKITGYYNGSLIFGTEP
jgi:endoglucanase